MKREEFEVAIKALVKEAFETTFNEATEARMNTITESRKAKESEDSGDKDDEDDESDEKENNDGEDGEGDEDDEHLEEALKVGAMLAKPGVHVEEFTVANMRELSKLARTGKYQGFTVTNPRNGEESEYIVEKGKLVIM